MSKTKTLKIAVFAISSMTIAIFATQPAQAKFGLMGGYKYVAVQSALNYDAHVAQLDFLRTTKGEGGGYREGGKRPYQVFGFGVAIGGNSRPPIDTGVVSFQGSSIYFALPSIYEYVFDFGLGISGGVTVPIIATFGGDDFGIGVGVGISDVGLSYHFNNGLTLYTRADFGYATLFGFSEESIGSIRGVMWGAGGGLGYWF